MNTRIKKFITGDILLNIMSPLLFKNIIKLSLIKLQKLQDSVKFLSKMQLMKFKVELNFILVSSTLFSLLYSTIVYKTWLLPVNITEHLPPLPNSPISISIPKPCVIDGSFKNNNPHLKPGTLVLQFGNGLQDCFILYKFNLK